MLAKHGHTLLIHGRSEAKLANAKHQLSELSGVGNIETYQADLTKMSDVTKLAKEITDKHSSLDVLINNAGVYTTPSPLTDQGLDVRFVVNTLAPYLLTQQIAPLMSATGRVINLSSAAQSTVDLDALRGKVKLDIAGQAYAQRKLAITMWSFYLAQKNQKDWPSIIAVNPGSLLASKMVKDAYGIEGKSLSLGAEILVKAALDDEFSKASGKYYDNDNNTFAAPHEDAHNPEKNIALVQTIESLLQRLA